MPQRTHTSNTFLFTLALGARFISDQSPVGGQCWTEWSNISALYRVVMFVLRSATMVYTGDHGQGEGGGAVDARSSPGSVTKKSPSDT